MDSHVDQIVALTARFTPDLVVPVTKDIEAKLYNQWDMIYAMGKKPKSAVKKEDLVPDETLLRAEERSFATSCCICSVKSGLTP